MSKFATNFNFEHISGAPSISDFAEMQSTNSLFNSEKIIKRIQSTLEPSYMMNNCIRN